MPPGDVGPERRRPGKLFRAELALEGLPLAVLLAEVANHVVLTGETRFANLAPIF